MNPLPCGSKGKLVFTGEETALYEDTVELAGGGDTDSVSGMEREQGSGPIHWTTVTFQEVWKWRNQKNEADDIVL